MADNRTTINLSVPDDMKQWLQLKADEGETKIAPIVRAIIRKAMNEESEKK